MIKRKDYKKIATLSVKRINDKVWLSAVNRNGIYTIENEIVDFLFSEEEHDLIDQELYGKIVVYDKKLFFTPINSKVIKIIDTETNNTMTISLNTEDNYNYKYRYKNYMRFWESVIVDEYVYFFGYWSQYILKMNINTYELKYISEWLNKIPNNILNESGKGFITDGHIAVGNLLYLPLGCISAVLIFNVDTNESHIKKISCAFNGIGGICEFEKENTYLLVGNGKNTEYLVLWDEKTNKVEHILIDDSIKGMEYPFYAPLRVLDDYYLFPIEAKHIYKYNNISKKTEIVEVFEEVFEDYGLGESLNVRSVLYHEYYDDCIEFITGHNLKWHRYSIKQKRLDSFFLISEYGTEDYYKSVVNYIDARRNILSEKEISFELFISLIGDGLI